MVTLKFIDTVNDKTDLEIFGYGVEQRYKS